MRSSTVPAEFPVRVAVPVALIAPFRTELAMPDTAHGFALQLHQALGGKADSSRVGMSCRSPFSRSVRRAILSWVIRLILGSELCAATQRYSGSPRWPLTRLRQALDDGPSQ